MYRYHTHYPDAYFEQAKYWPLIIILHGSGERDIPFEELQQHAYFQASYQLTAARFPALVTVPQCPAGERWNPEKLEELSLQLLADEKVDSRRIALCGFSMGGYGCWHTAARYPNRYSAIAPICGGGNIEDAEALCSTAIWAFHGAKDPIIPVDETYRMIDALTAAGAEPLLTIYENGEHNVWDETLASPALYYWLLQQNNN